MRRGFDSSHDLLVPIPAFVALFYGVCVERKARSLCSGHARHTFMWRQRKIARIRCGLASARQVLQRRLRERPNQGRAIIHAIWGPELLCGTPPVSDIAMVCAPHIGREQRVHWRGNSHGYWHGDSARAPPQRTALLAPLEYMSCGAMTTCKCRIMDWKPGGQRWCWQALVTSLPRPTGRRGRQLRVRLCSPAGPHP